MFNFVKNNNMRISEIKTINVEQCSPDNPMLLSWLNPLGGFDFWLFGKRQSKSHDIDSGSEFIPAIHYLDETDGVQRTIQKTKFEVVTVGAEQLSKQQVNGISHILSSPLIYLITGQPQTDDFKTTIVTIKGGTFFIMDTWETKQKIEFDIIMPQIFTQSS